MTIHIRTGSIPVLYHGTSLAAAKKICRSGFKRSRQDSYTGHGVCLSESITVAYEYGLYEEAGCVLEVILHPETRWSDGTGRDRVGSSYDELFRDHPVDALCTFSGNVWILWDVAIPATVRIMTHKEAIVQMTKEFDANGADVGYNNVIDDYATIWWGQEQSSPHLQRYPDDLAELKARLQSFTGRATSTLLLAPQQVTA